MRIFVCEYHRYRSSTPVGSHRFADEFRKRGHEIVWFSHPRTTLHRVRGAIPPKRIQHDDGVTEITLRAQAPYMEMPIFNSLAWGKRWLAGNRGLLQTTGLDHCDLMWMSNFTMLGILDLVKASSVVFRFFDRIERFDKMPRSIFDLVDYCRAHADLVIASSSTVCDDLEKRGINAHHIPNAVDASRFSRELALRDNRPNRVVYIGALQSWFDLAAVERWAVALPSIEFLIVGPNDIGMRSSVPNIKIMGPVPSLELPTLLATARFGIIPFKMNDLTQGIHPLKIYEYLASGCMVLSARLPDVPEIEGAVFAYDTPEEGTAVLEENWTRKVDRKILRSVAVTESWSKRVDDVAAQLGVEL